MKRRGLFCQLMKVYPRLTFKSKLGKYDLCGDLPLSIIRASAMAPPARTDEQILPRIRWVPIISADIGKSNCYLNEEKSQPSPIFKIVVDILQQTNFFRAFTASSIIAAIYIQQFWDTICFDSKAVSYKCQLDEQWFDLTQDTLRDALQITPVDKNQAFSSPHDFLIRLSEFVKFFFNKDLEYLRFGNKGDRLALSITKIKAAHYPDAGLKHMVPDQMWIEEE
ncbi:hypothetical protein Tco_0102828 [Tanacetum coccineum]